MTVASIALALEPMLKRSWRLTLPANASRTYRDDRILSAYDGNKRKDL
jgi:hypothetical protein